MISESEARRQAVDFFDSENLPELSEMVGKKIVCLSEIFPKAVRSLGKKRVLVLYRKLPSELRKYFLIHFLSNSKRLNEKLQKIDDKYGISKDPFSNSKYLQAVEKALIWYLEE